MSNGSFILCLDTIESDAVYEAVMKELGHLDSIWVAELDLCEMYGCVKYDVFENVEALHEEFKDEELERHPTLPLLKNEYHHLIMPERVAVLF